MFIYLKNEPSFFYRPWSMCMGFRFPVHFLLTRNFFRFRRPFLPEENSELNVQSYLKKFTLPVFKGSLDKMPGTEILQQPDRRLAMFFKKLIVFVQPGAGLATKANYSKQ